MILYPDAEPVGRQGVARIAQHLSQSWDWDLKVSVVWPVTRPADEAPPEEIRRNLRDCIRPFNQLMYDRLLVC